MRIDLNPSAMPELERSRGSGSAAKAGQGNVNGCPESSDDVASLSTGSDAVASLRAQLDQVPDIRQQRVEMLRQAIGEGQFTISPNRIAEGMLAEAK